MNVAVVAESAGLIGRDNLIRAGLTEAWSCRKPVIGGKIPAIESVIADGEDGLVTPHDGAELAERIMALLHDPGLCQRMGEKGRDKVRRQYSWKVLARKTREVYDSLL